MASAPTCQEILSYQIIIKFPPNLKINALTTAKKIKLCQGQNIIFGERASAFILGKICMILTYFGKRDLKFNRNFYIYIAGSSK
jgi:hypothetical protein